MDISPSNLDFNLCLIHSSIFHAYKLNKWGDNIQPWHTSFPIWNQFVVPFPVLTIASSPVNRLLRRQVRWFGIPISWRIFCSFWWSTRSKALQSHSQSHKGSPRMLECVAYPFSIGSSKPKDQTGASCIARRFCTNWAISEAPTPPSKREYLLPKNLWIFK